MSTKESKGEKERTRGSTGRDGKPCSPAENCSRPVATDDNGQFLHEVCMEGSSILPSSRCRAHCLWAECQLTARLGHLAASSALISTAEPDFRNCHLVRESCRSSLRVSGSQAPVDSANRHEVDPLLCAKSGRVQVGCLRVKTRKRKRPLLRSRS